MVKIKIGISASVYFDLENVPPAAALTFLAQWFKAVLNTDTLTQAQINELTAQVKGDNDSLADAVAQAHS